MMFRLGFWIFAAGVLMLGPAVADTAAQHSDIDTEHLFGFTEGSDIGHKGEVELESSATGRAGKLGHFAAINDAASLRYGVTDRIRASFGVMADYQTIRGVPGVTDHSGVGFSGLTGELRIRLLDRESSPLGLTVSFNPSWRRLDDTTLAPVSTYALPVALLADAAIVPGKMFAALNIAFTPSVTRANALWQREHTFEISPAVTAALNPNVFIGAEVRHLHRHLNGVTAHAVFVGPSVFVKLNESLILKAAWSMQVPDETTARLDLVNFERHQIRAQIVKSF